jgi:hypothetical protein
MQVNHRHCRDNEPHRAPLLKLLAILGMMLGLGSCLILPGVLGLFLGLAFQSMADRDLGKMAAGLMDPRGEGEVKSAQRMCRVAVILNGVLLGVPWLMLLCIYLYNILCSVFGVLS